MHFRTKLVLTLLVTLPSTLAIVNGDCTGRTGVCVSTSTCNKYGGTYYNNKCPNDPNDIKCCDNIPCSSGGQQGKCMKTSQCNGKTVAGLCPGNNDFKCCLSSTECTYQGLKGVCKNVSQCDGFNVSGLCPGGNEIRCCLPKNSCSSNGLSGQCIPVGQCSTNNIVSGLCLGGNEIKCCLPNSGNNGNLKSLVTSLLLFEEGTNPKGVCIPYIDSQGYPTIGYGQLCKKVVVSIQAQANSACASYKNGCTAQKVRQWLSDKIDEKTKCINNYANIRNAYNKASIKRKAIITSMAFQLGCYGLSKFEKTLKHMANGSWSNAADEMMNSNWARQTPNRAKRHSYVIRNDSCGNFCSNYGW